jgi:hypothetical protein
MGARAAGVPDARFLRGGVEGSGASIRSHGDSASNPTCPKDREKPVLNEAEGMGDHLCREG